MRNKFTNVFKAALKGTLVLMLAGIFTSSVNAQCTTGALYITNFTPTCTGTPQLVAGCQYAGEYSTVNLTAGVTYTFTSSIGTDYITVADDATNTAVAFGTTPVLYTPGVSGLYRVYTHLDPGCGTVNACRDLSVQCGTPPPPIVNDLCSGATTVTCGYSASGTTVGANADAVVACGTGSGPGLWYTFVGDGQPWTVSFCGSTYDTYMAIYSGPSCAAMACVGSNDDFCGLQSQMTVPTTIGTVYYVEINGFGGQSGNYTINVTTPCCAPANDNCSAATVITPGTVSGSILACNNVDVVPLCGTASAPTAGGAWYSYTPGCSGQVTASLCGAGTNYDTQLSIFDGTCGALNCIDGNNDALCGTASEVSWAGTSGTTYYILVHGNAAIGNYDLTLSQQDLTAPTPDAGSLAPVNTVCSVTLTAPTATDNCAGAITGTTPQTTFVLNGVYNVVWTYDDGNGNLSTQTQVVTVADNIAPTSMLPNDTTISADAGACCATFYFSQAAGPIVDQVGNGFEDGWNNSGVFVAADDMNVPAGATWNINAATFDAFTVLPLPSSIDVVFYADAGGFPGAVVGTDNITAGNYTATVVGNNFGIDVYHYDFTLTAPVALAGGAGGATYWVAFQNNGTGASYWEISSLGAYGSNSLQVNGPLAGANWAGPYVNAGADQVFSLTVGAIPLFVDNCNGPVVEAQTAGNASGSCFPVGTTTNTYTGTDENGNVTTASFTVTVIDDQPPIPDLDSAAAYSFSSTTLPMAIVDGATIMDSILVSGVPNILATGDIASVCIDLDHGFDSDLTISLISPSGTVYILSDANGGAEDDYTQTCFDMNAAMSINAADAPFVGSFIPEGAGGFDSFNGEDPNGYWKLAIFDIGFGDVGALMEFGINFDFHWEDLLPVAQGGCMTVTAPTASDNCGTTITATSTDPIAFTNDGTYIINWTYTDGAGNTTTQSQTVVIDDVTGPVADVDPLPVVTADCSATIETPPTATDGCTGAATVSTSDPISYNTIGTHVVTWNYVDGNGNTTTQTQTVIVTDNTAPVPNQPILANVTGNCTVTVPAPPTATDNCEGVITGTTTDPTTYNVVGTFFIIWHFDDGNGNISTQNQTVVVNPCLGIEDESGQWNALIYPNPSSGIFTLTLSQMPTENTQVRLVDALGQVLYSEMLQGQVQQFDFSSLASATYYLLITNDNGQISKPVIIRHDY